MYLSESSCQTVLQPPQQALLSHSEENVKPQFKNDSQLGGLQETCNERDLPSRQAALLLYHLLQKPPLLRPLHPAEKERQRQQCAGTLWSLSRGLSSPNIPLCFKPADLISLWVVGAAESLHNLWSTAPPCVSHIRHLSMSASTDAYIYKYPVTNKQRGL